MYTQHTKLVIFTFTFLFSTTMDASKKGRHFVQSHRLPQEVIKRADTIFSNKKIYRAMRRANKRQLQEAGFHVIAAQDNIIIEHSDLPGYIIKFGNRFGGFFSTIGRIRMAEKIDRYLQRKNITTVHVPQKFLYHIPHRRHKLIDKNYLVFSQKVNVQPKGVPRILSKKAIQDTCQVINRFAIVDASPGNISLLDKENVAILDTEPTIRTGGGMWYVLDNPLTRIVQSTIGTFLFRRSVEES